MLPKEPNLLLPPSFFSTTWFYLLKSEKYCFLPNSHSTIWNMWVVIFSISHTSSHLTLKSSGVAIPILQRRKQTQWGKSPESHLQIPVLHYSNVSPVRSLNICIRITEAACCKSRSLGGHPRSLWSRISGGKSTGSTHILTHISVDF